MTNPNRNHSIDELIEILQNYGVKTVRTGCNQAVCSFPDGNYILKMSPTEISLEAARQMEKTRLRNHAERYKAWEHAAWERAAAAERRALQHRATMESFLEQLNKLE